MSGLEESHTSPGLRATITAAVIVAAVAVLYPLSRVDYLLFHSIVEAFGALVAFGIFVIAWNTRAIVDNRYLLVLGVANLFVGMVAMLHTFAYKGMGVFPNAGANLPTQLWAISRLLEAAGFLVAGLALRHTVSAKAALIGFGGATAAALTSVFVVRVFPVMYREGVGLTPVKLGAEYLTVAALAVSAWLLWRDRDRFEPSVARLLVASMGLMMAAELAFTLYVDVYGALNFVGHILAVGGFALVYIALIDTALRRPYSLLFLELARRERAEHDISETLQNAVLTAPDHVASVQLGHAYVSATATARVGGDFYDLFSPRSDLAAFVIGDMCGKGIEAAAATTMIRTTLRGYAYDDPEPAEVLRRANDAVGRQLSDDKFATVVYGTIDTGSGEVRVASAGHPSPLVCNISGARCLDVPTNPPLGVVDDQQFEIAQARLDSGDMLVLFTDGLLDARDGDEAFGLERVIEHATASTVDPSMTARVLLDAAVRHAQGTLADDVAVVALRYVAG